MAIGECGSQAERETQARERSHRAWWRSTFQRLAAIGTLTGSGATLGMVVTRAP